MNSTNKTPNSFPREIYGYPVVGMEPTDKGSLEMPGGNVKVHFYGSKAPAFYVLSKTVTQIIEDANQYLEPGYKRQLQNKPDSFVLGSAAKQIDVAKEGEKIFVIAQPIIINVCQITDEECIKTVCKKIYANLIRDNLTHTDNCTKITEDKENIFGKNKNVAVLNIISDCSHKVIQNGLAFQITTKGKKIVPNFNIQLFNNQSDLKTFVAFTDHLKGRLFLRSAFPFAHGAQKNVHDIEWVWLQGAPTNVIEMPKQACFNCVSELSNSETSLLEKWDSPYIIQPPEFLNKVHWSGFTRYQYITDKALGTLNSQFILENQISYERLQQYFLDVAQGLKYLREQEYVHSDLKPDNILIFNNAKIADFGSCSVPKASNWGDGITICSPEIMLKNEPENKNHKGYPHDMFALGYSMYELGSGKKPYCNGESFSCTREELFTDERQRKHEEILFGDWSESEDAYEMRLRETSIKLMTLNPENRMDAGQLIEALSYRK